MPAMIISFAIILNTFLTFTINNKSLGEYQFSLLRLQGIYRIRVYALRFRFQSKIIRYEVKRGRHFGHQNGAFFQKKKKKRNYFGYIKMLKWSLFLNEHALRNIVIY